ncbi:32971_t:CDS:2, partial [Racocetra persica]
AILDPNNKLILFENKDISKTQKDYFHQHLKKSYDMFVDNDNSLKEYLSLPIEE